MIKISIIMAVFNAENTLDNAIKNIICNITTECELIIIDGKSTDKSVEIIKKYHKNIAYWISEKDTGIYNAWNKGLKKARGEYISFIGADDLILPNYVEDYINLIDKRIGYDFISSRASMRQNNKEIIFGSCWNYDIFKKYMNIAHVGSMHRRSLFDNIGYYNELYKIAGDYELLLRKGKQLNATFINSLTVEMGAFGISNVNYKLALKESFRAKITNKSRYILFAYFDYIIALLKIYIKKYYENIK